MFQYFSSNIFHSVFQQVTTLSSVPLISSFAKPTLIIVFSKGLHPSSRIVFGHRSVTRSESQTDFIQLEAHHRDWHGIAGMQL